MPEKINIIISDWQILFREGIHYTISSEEDLVVIGETLNEDELLHMIMKQKPNLVIANIGKENFSGLEVFKQVKRELPSVNFIITLDIYDEKNVYTLLKNGVNAFICKDNTPDEVIKVIRAAGNGLFPIATVLLKPVIAEMVIHEFEKFLSVDLFLEKYMAPLNQTEVNLLKTVSRNEKLNDEGRPVIEIAQCLESIRNKLVANSHHYEIFFTARSQIQAVSSPDDLSNRFVTIEDFNEFRIRIENQIRQIQKTIEMTLKPANQ